MRRRGRFRGHHRPTPWFGVLLPDPSRPTGEDGVLRPGRSRPSEDGGRPRRGRSRSTGTCIAIAPARWADRSTTRPTEDGARRLRPDGTHRGSPRGLFHERPRVPRPASPRARRRPPRPGVLRPRLDLGGPPHRPGPGGISRCQPPGVTARCRPPGVPPRPLTRSGRPRPTTGDLTHQTGDVLRPPIDGEPTVWIAERRRWRDGSPAGSAPSRDTTRRPWWARWRPCPR